MQRAWPLLGPIWRRFRIHQASPPDQVFCIPSEAVSPKLVYNSSKPLKSVTLRTVDGLFQDKFQRKIAWDWSRNSEPGTSSQSHLIHYISIRPAPSFNSISPTTYCEVNLANTPCPKLICRGKGMLWERALAFCLREKMDGSYTTGEYCKMPKCGLELGFMTPLRLLRYV